MFDALDEERRWKEVMMHLSEGVVTFDENLQICYINHAALSALEINESSEVNSRIEKIMTLTFLGDPQSLKRVFEGKDESEVTFIYRTLIGLFPSFSSSLDYYSIIHS
jgi:signal transduction histidine kinase